MDDLFSTKFDPLVQVLNCSASKREIKYLLMPKNILEVIDNPEEFIPQDIPMLNFLGSANV